MSYQKQKKNNKGFTLVEILLAITLTTGLLLSLVVFAQHVNESQVKQRSIREVNEQGELIMAKIVYAIRSAESITSPATSGSTVSELELSYANPSIDPIEVSVDTGILMYSEDNDPEIPLHNESISVVDFTVTNVTQTAAWDTVDVSLTLRYESTSQRYIYDYEKTWDTTVVIRNYER